jgi:pimeloyl-ACP methyl ester carboxylesterase
VAAQPLRAPCEASFIGEQEATSSPPCRLLDQLVGKVPTLIDSHVTTLSDGRDLGWLELGPTDGWPIFGFHGTPGSRLQMAIDEAAVRRAGVRVIAPDRPGYGLSTFQPERRLIDWPSDVAELADHLGIDRFSVVGISGGGPHAVVCAALLEGRLAAAGIVSGEGPLTDPRIAAEMTRSTKLLTTLARRRSRLLRAFFDVEIAFARRWPSAALDLMSRQLPPADAELLRRPALRSLFEDDVRRSSRTTARAQAQDFELFSKDWGVDLAAITVPVILWQGDDDRNVPPQHARMMHDAMPKSVLHTFEGEGHFLVADRLEEILIALRG